MLNDDDILVSDLLLQIFGVGLVEIQVIVEDIMLFEQVEQVYLEKICKYFDGSLDEFVNKFDVSICIFYRKL